MKKPSTAVIVLLLFILSMILILPRILQVRQLNERSRNLESELRKLELQNRVLENELRLLRDDPVYLEKVARAKFNKAKQGEVVYKVVHE